MSRIRIYSPNQVAVFAFFGGPLAAIYVLWRNFRARGNDDGAAQIILYGSIFIVALMVVLPILPDHFPNYVIPFAYTAAAHALARQYQLTKQAIGESAQYEFQSGWNVFGIAVACLIAFFVLFVGEVLLLGYLGIVEL
jgi:4-amino-4-deoxy-L-arabinose transferase-like glycosyltransferase